NEAYNTLSSSWKTLANLPSARGHAMAAVALGKVYVIGGNTTTPQKEETKTVFVYDPLSNSWTQKTPMPESTNGGAAVTLDGIIYVTMGDDSRHVYAYDPAHDTW